MSLKMTFALSILFCAFTVHARGQDLDYPIKPHRETQDLLEKWIATMDPAQLEHHYDLLAQLRPLASEDYRRFVRQVVYAHHRQEEMGEGVLLGDLFTICVPEVDVAIALVPYLYGQHPKVRKLARQLLLYPHCGGYPPGFADLSHLADAAHSDNEEIATPVRRAIFEVAPNSAVRLFIGEVQVMERFKLRRAERTLVNDLFERNITTAERSNYSRARERGEPVGDLPLAPPWKLTEKSISALRTLATNEHWWARMFASEFMFRNEDFRVEELIEKLEQDDNDLVRQSAASIKTPNPLRLPAVVPLPALE